MPVPQTFSDLRQCQTTMTQKEQSVEQQVGHLVHELDIIRVLRGNDRFDSLLPPLLGDPIEAALGQPRDVRAFRPLHQTGLDDAFQFREEA